MTWKTVSSVWCFYALKITKWLRDIMQLKSLDSETTIALPKYGNLSDNSYNCIYSRVLGYFASTAVRYSMPIIQTERTNATYYLDFSLPMTNLYSLRQWHTTMRNGSEQDCSSCLPAEFADSMSLISVHRHYLNEPRFTNNYCALLFLYSLYLQFFCIHAY